MSDEGEITRDDIPQVEELKTAILAELDSGRARSSEAVQKDVSSHLGLSTKQRRFKVTGSKTTLLSNRFDKARTELKAEGLIAYPAHGKMKLVRHEGDEKPPAEPQKPTKKEAAPSPGAPADESAKHAADKQPHKEPAPASPVAPSPDSASEHATATTKTEERSAQADLEPKGPWTRYRAYAPLALVALGLLLCLAQWGLPGAILGGAGLFLRAKGSKGGGAGTPAAPKATLWAGVASILLGVVLTFASCSGAASNTPSGDAPANPSASAQTTSSDDARGMLSFKVTAADWPDKSVPVRVSIERKTAEGKTVSDHREATVGTTYRLSYGAGDYTFAVEQGSLVCKDVPFTAEPSSCTFDGSKDRLVTLDLAKDEKALAAAEEAKKQQEAEAERKAAEEAAAAAQAEAERQAEEAAAAAAAAAVAQADNAAQAGPSSGGGSYIGNVNTYKFHRPTCGTLPKEKNRIYFSSRDEAVNSGYVPCKNCNP